MEDLTTVFGESLLAYVLGLNGLELPFTPTEAQSQVFAQLRELLAATDNQLAVQRFHNLQSLLVAYDPEHQGTLANLMRAACGREVTAREDSGDQVADELLSLAQDIYPGYLVRSPADYLDPMLTAPSTGTLRHPDHSHLLWSLLQDEFLTKLFPGASTELTPEDTTELMQVTSYIVGSTGHANGLQLVLLPGIILRSAYERVVLAGRSGYDAYLDMVLSVLDDIRKLASKKPVETPVVVGLSNVKLTEGEAIALPKGLLRKIRPEDSRWFLPVAPDPSVVLITTTPVRLLAIQWPAPEEPAVDIERYQHEFERVHLNSQRDVNLTRFALLLAAHEPPYHAAVEGMRRILNPFHLVGMASMSQPSMSPAPETTVEPTSFAAIEAWAREVQRHPVKLDVAMRRLLSAATARTDPLDGLIDAVLAWENMFSGTPETNLRVCGAIALLLEPDSFENRKSLFRELKNLYTARSGLVHGSAEPELRDAVRMRDRAVEIGLDSMRRLYKYPDLLHQADSAVRGSDILLGATR